MIKLTEKAVKSFPQNSVENDVEIHRAAVAKLLQTNTYGILHKRAARLQSLKVQVVKLLCVDAFSFGRFKVQRVQDLQLHSEDRLTRKCNLLIVGPTPPASQLLRATDGEQFVGKSVSPFFPKELTLEGKSKVRSIGSFPLTRG